MDLSQEEIDKILKGELSPPPAGEEAAEEVAGGKVPVVERVQFTQLEEKPGLAAGKANMDIIRKIPLTVSAELGRTSITVRELLNLEKGSVLRLDKMAGEGVTLLANDQPFAEGEVVVIGDNYAVRVTALGLKKAQDQR